VAIVVLIATHVINIMVNGMKRQNKLTKFSTTHKPNDGGFLYKKNHIATADIYINIIKTTNENILLFLRGKE